MPIEIRELIIRAHVTSEAPAAPATPEEAQSQERVNKQELLADCLDQLLEVLTRKKER